MDSIEEKELTQKIQTGTLTAADRSQNPELRAMLSLRNFSAILEKHYAQILEIEQATDTINSQALDLNGATWPAESVGKWQAALHEFKASVSAINKVLTDVKEKIAIKDRSDSAALWQSYDRQMQLLKASYETLDALGASLLPADQHQHWRVNGGNFEGKVLPLITSYGAACRVELRIIERFSPEELNEVTQIILDHIPENFTFAEADAYEKEYLAALRDFKQEFSTKKNLWDKFLDVLAGGDHQSPSEHVMMSRWLDGEKGDL